MTLPDEIPKKLRDSALFLPEMDDNEGAWLKTDAMSVIKSLEGTDVSVSNVTIFNMAPWGYSQSDSALSVHRFPNENDADYALRSCSLALDFIRDSITVDEKALFALTFPLWKDAA